MAERSDRTPQDEAVELDACERREGREPVARGGDDHVGRGARDGERHEIDERGLAAREQRSHVAQHLARAHGRAENEPDAIGRRVYVGLLRLSGDPLGWPP